MADVAAGREGALAGRLDHHARDRRIVAPGVELRAQRHRHAVRDGVERLRPVEGDEAGRAAPLEQDFGRGRHSGSLIPAQAGIQGCKLRHCLSPWLPAFAGTSGKVIGIDQFPNICRLMISRMISLVPSRIWCTRTSRKHALDRVIAQIAVAAVQLQAAIDHLEAGIGGEPLGLGGERASRPARFRRPRPPRGAAAGARLRFRSRSRRCGIAAPGNRQAASRIACAPSCRRRCGRDRTARRRASRRRC